MDVQCERCKAEYEFDDALISGRGTTVKCTNCGYQFKIRKPTETADAGPDRWAVRTTEGRDLVFTSLRELQKAIHARQVGRADTLMRGQSPPRALGAIAELEPFFDEAAEQRGHQSGSGARPPPDAKPTLSSSAAVAQVPPRKSSRPPPPLGGRTIPTLRPVVGPTPPPATLPPVPAMRPRIDTIRPPASANAAVPPPLQTTKHPPATSPYGAAFSPGAPVMVAPVYAAAAEPVPESVEPDPESVEPETARVERVERPASLYPDASDAMIPLRPAPKTLVHAPASPPGPPSFASSPPAPAPLAPPREVFRSLPPPTISVETPARSLPPPTVPVRMPEPRRALSSIDDDPDDIEMAGRPRRLGGWLVALVLVAGVGVLGFGLAKPYLEARATKTAAPASTLDPRAAQFLADGERALGAGDLEGANDAFTKASALAETDPRTLLDVARLANARADVPWLRSRVLPSDAADDQRATKAQLGELGDRAKKAASEASAAAPDQASAILAKIDALRITGDGVGARALVSKVIQNASQPETAYALAALDLAEPEPLWPMVIERLRLAAAGEGDAGRARAALVYALARSGDGVGAKAELEKLAGLSRPYPIVGVLRAFVAKVPSGRDAGAHAVVDVSALPHAVAHASGGGGGGGGGGGPSYSGSNDPRFLLAQAESAKGSHDYDRARALYSSALAQNASDSEALAGLGDVEHASRNPAGAASYYKRALAVNPVYLPALVGLGDVEWESGDRDEAQKTYRDIMDRFPEGTYAGRVRQRAMDTSSGSSPATGSTSAASTAAAPPSSASTGGSP